MHLLDGMCDGAADGGGMRCSDLRRGGGDADMEGA